MTGESSERLDAPEPRIQRLDAPEPRIQLEDGGGRLQRRDAAWRRADLAHETSALPELKAAEEYGSRCYLG